MTLVIEEIESRKGQTAVHYHCDNCHIDSWSRGSHFRRKIRHFCSMFCYADYRKNEMPPNQQPTWRGGVSNTEAHRRWKKKNPERMAHLKARRYARERGAKGNHNLDEWNGLKAMAGYRCKHCGEVKPLTKDHIIPLSAGGSDYISNIQPLCRNCNSKKWKHIHENPLEAKP